MEETQKAERHLKNCSTFLAIRFMQIKMTLRYHLIPVRMAKIKNINDSLCWRGCEVRKTLLHCCWECTLLQPLWKSVWRFLRKLGVNLSPDPPTTLGHIPKGSYYIESYYKNICSIIFKAALFVISRTWKQP